MRSLERRAGKEYWIGAAYTHCPSPGAMVHSCLQGGLREPQSITPEYVGHSGQHPVPARAQTTLEIVGLPTPDIAILLSLGKGGVDFIFSFGDRLSL